MDHWCPQTSGGATRPIGTPIPAEDGPEEHHGTEQHGLDRPHKQDCLRLAMPKCEMGHIEKGRASGRTGVDDLENRIEVAIEIDHRTCPSFKHEDLIALVPPTMRRSLRKSQALARSRIDALTIHNRGECAGRDPASLVFQEVDVQGWTLAMWEQRATKLQPDLTAFRNSPKLQAFFGVPILQHKRPSVPTWVRHFFPTKLD